VAVNPDRALSSRAREGRQAKGVAKGARVVNRVMAGVNTSSDSRFRAVHPLKTRGTRKALNRVRALRARVTARAIRVASSSEFATAMANQ
jgi:hypothetical protein